MSYWLWCPRDILVTLIGVTAQVSIHSSASLEFEVAASLVAPLRETLLQLYFVSAETLHLTVQAFVHQRAQLSELLEARARLNQLGETLDQMKWSHEDGSGMSEISVPIDVLLDATMGALIDAQERLASIWSAAGYRASTAASVRELTHGVSELQELLTRVRAGQAVRELAAGLQVD